MHVYFERCVCVVLGAWIRVEAASIVYVRGGCFVNYFLGLNRV